MVSQPAVGLSSAALDTCRRRTAEDRNGQDGAADSARVVLVTPESQDMRGIDTDRGLMSPDRPLRVIGARLSHWQMDHRVRNHCALRAQRRTVYLPFTFGDS